MTDATDTSASRRRLVSATGLREYTSRELVDVLYDRAASLTWRIAAEDILTERGISVRRDGGTFRPKTTLLGLISLRERGDRGTFYSVLVSVRGEGSENQWYRPQRGVRVCATDEKAAIRAALAKFPGQDARLVRCDVSKRQDEGQAV